MREQVLVAPLPPRVHVPPLLKVPLDDGLVEKVTVPVGVTCVPPEVSVTLTVQVVGTLTGPEEGEQETDVPVDRMLVIVCASNGMT